MIAPSFYWLVGMGLAHESNLRQITAKLSRKKELPKLIDSPRNIAPPRNIARHIQTSNGQKKQNPAL